MFVGEVVVVITLAILLTCVVLIIRRPFCPPVEALWVTMGCL